MKKYFILFLLCICISVCFISLLQKEKKVKEYNSLENVELAVYLDEQEIDFFPIKDNQEGYVFDKATCYVNGIETSDVHVTWDSEAWAPVFNGLSTYKTNCNLYFRLDVPTKIRLQLDTSGACPEVTDSGEVLVSSGESSRGYVCSAPDDYGMSYYFRGNVENNWVKFAGFYWRIIRVNGDGSIRMIYAGDASVIDALENKEEVLKNGYSDNITHYTIVGRSPFNAYFSDNASLGYMYGNSSGNVESSTNYYQPLVQESTDTYYYAQSFTYNEQTKQYTLNNPVAISGDALTTDYIGWYTTGSSEVSASNNLRRVTGVTKNGTSSTITFHFVAYGTTSKENAQANINDSTIKATVDTWYEKSLKGTEYESAIADVLFCNDRSISEHKFRDDYSNLGYGVEQTVYRWGYRPTDTTNKQYPRLSCANQNDQFTVTSGTLGNGDLTYSVGLLTRDEAFLAGGFDVTNRSFYLYNGDWYWTMSPVHFEATNAYGSFVYSDGTVAGNSILSSSGGVRPVINIYGYVLNQGDGSASKPYQMS